MVIHRSFYLFRTWKKWSFPAFIQVPSIQSILSQLMMLTNMLMLSVYQWMTKASRYKGSWIREHTARSKRQWNFLPELSIKKACKGRRGTMSNLHEVLLISSHRVHDLYKTSPIMWTGMKKAGQVLKKSGI